MSRSLFSYIVRYDSGFAPNPFYGYSTLATCKPGIRKSAQVGDWLLGMGSNQKKIRRGGYVVHAMRVSETLTTGEYWNDPRFKKKRPQVGLSLRHASGDNIYEPDGLGGWIQHNSYHSNPDGSRKANHVARDTSVQRVLVSNEYTYWGAEGPKLPEKFQPGGQSALFNQGIGEKRTTDKKLIEEFENWYVEFGSGGFQGKPWDWLVRERSRS